MSDCVEKIGCNSCGSSDAKQVFEDDGKYTAYCFACGTYDHNPYKDHPKDYKPVALKKSPEEVAKELYEISLLPVVDIPERGLTAATLTYFGVHVGLSQVDGQTPNILYRPYTKDGEFMAYKAKMLDQKKVWSHGNQKEVDPFGWYQALHSGNSKLIITEGEEDAMALYQMIKDKNQDTAYKELVPAVISVPHGAAGSVRDLAKHAGVIESVFKEVILAFDMDDVGQKWAEEVIKSALPTASVAKLPAKDANACLIEGRVKACVNAVLWNSSVPKNSAIKTVAELIQKAKEPPKYGYSYPWEGLTQHTRGLRTGEVVYIPAAVKAGKSTMVNQIGAHLMLEEDVTCMFIKPEEASHKTLQMLAGTVAETIFHDPSKHFDEDKFDKAIERIKDKMIILDSYQLLDWNVIKRDIVYAVVNAGVKVVFLDPLTSLTAAMSVSQANEFLQHFCPEIAKMAIDYDVAFIIPVHLKASESGVGHEEGGRVMLKELVGSRAMIRSGHVIMALEKPLKAESKEEKNVRILRILADRNLGVSGGIRMYYNENSGKLEQFEVFD